MCKIMEDYLKERTAEKDELITQKDNQLAEKDELITQKDNQLAEKDDLITKKDEEIESLKKQLAATQNSN